MMTTEDRYKFAAGVALVLLLARLRFGPFGFGGGDAGELGREVRVKVTATVVVVDGRLFTVEQIDEALIFAGSLGAESFHLVATGDARAGDLQEVRAALDEIGAVRGGAP